MNILRKNKYRLLSIIARHSFVFIVTGSLFIANIVLAASPVIMSYKADKTTLTITLTNVASTKYNVMGDLYTSTGGKKVQTIVFGDMDPKQAVTKKTITLDPGSYDLEVQAFPYINGVVSINPEKVPFRYARTAGATTGNGTIPPNNGTIPPDNGTIPPGNGTDVKINSGIKNPLGPNLQDIPSFIRAIIDFVLLIGIPIVALAIIYCGFLFVTAAGNSEKLKKAKQALLYTLIGAALLLGAFVVADAIKGTVDEIKSTT